MSMSMSMSMPLRPAFIAAVPLDVAVCAVVVEGVKRNCVLDHQGPASLYDEEKKWHRV